MLNGSALDFLCHLGVSVSSRRKPDGLPVGMGDKCHSIALIHNSTNLAIRTPALAALTHGLVPLAQVRPGPRFSLRIGRDDDLGGSQAAENQQDGRQHSGATDEHHGETAQLDPIEKARTGCANTLHEDAFVDAMGAPDDRVAGAGGTGHLQPALGAARHGSWLLCF
jgi:hypothetical protein